MKQDFFAFLTAFSVCFVVSWLLGVYGLEEETTRVTVSSLIASLVVAIATTAERVKMRKRKMGE